MSESLESAYRGRFAPSPTGLLHAGSLLAALASWLDARAHDGTWLIRIEDIDPPRDIPGAGEKIIETLSRFGFESDEPVLWQHDRLDAYRETAARLVSEGKAFGCACSGTISRSGIGSTGAILRSTRGSAETAPEVVNPGPSASGLIRSQSLLRTGVSGRSPRISKKSLATS